VITVSVVIPAEAPVGREIGIKISKTVLGYGGCSPSYGWCRGGTASAAVTLISKRIDAVTDAL
jgi:hypothetical protein